MREALVVQALGDLDSLLTRVESISSIVDGSEKRLQGTAAALDKAGDSYRMAITAYTESAKADLIEFTQRQGKQLADHTLEELRTSMHAAASAAFRTEASDKAAQLGIALGRAAKEFRRSLWSRLFEHGITALIAAACTAGLVIAFAHP
ncbi:MAG: hypothetical protein ABIQ32_12775 [Sphingomicrobium sp.]